jgi:hypothetical protein
MHRNRLKVKFHSRVNPPRAALVKRGLSNCYETDTNIFSTNDICFPVIGLYCYSILVLVGVILLASRESQVPHQESDLTVFPELSW